MSVHDLIKNSITRMDTAVLSIFLFACLVFLFAISAGSATLPDTVLSHQQGAGYAKAQPIPVQVRVTDSQSIVSVRSYFRFQEASDYLYVDLVADGDNLFQGVLPPPAEGVSTVEYFFLVVNGKYQVVRSPLYTLKPSEDGSDSGDSVAVESLYTLKTELPEIPAEVIQSFFNPDQVKIEKTSDGERFGLVGGVYSVIDFVTTDMTEGYYGGFTVNEKGEYASVKGFIPRLKEKKQADASSGQTSVPSTQEITPQVTSDIIGPDIQGDDWTGRSYFMDGHGNIYHQYDTEVSAIVTHEDEQVTITLTFYGPNWLGISEYFRGSMDESGNMTLYDELEPPETWTTHFNPATETSIIIADFTARYDPDENPYPDLYVVELSREPVPPPPPPEPELPLFLPAIYKLMLPQKTP